MKKAFTLVELLIVVMVIAILISITFKLMGLVGDQSARTKTIVRMQALENAVEGYFAAFGSYPPVRLHGSRNFWIPVNDAGVQLAEEEPVVGVLNMQQVEAACRSQPLAMACPFHKRWHGRIKSNAQMAQKFALQGDGNFGHPAYKLGFDALETPDQLSGKSDEPVWDYLQLFRFGLMSFLLPRYWLMMQCEQVDIYDRFAQWGDNNAIPCQFETGVPYDSWASLARDVIDNEDGTVNRNLWKVMLLPSQVVTARWVANFEKILKVQKPMDQNSEFKIFGVNVAGDESDFSISGLYTAAGGGPWYWLYSQGVVPRSGGSFTQAYALDGFTCVDGWRNEFFYYSAPPYQNYRIWSAGPPINPGAMRECATFPPWVSEKEIDDLGSDNAKQARLWKANDVVHMNN